MQLIERRIIAKTALSRSKNPVFGNALFDLRSNSIQVHHAD